MTITNTKTGEVYYQKIIPDDKPFYDTVSVHDIKYIINYTPNSDDSDTHTSYINGKCTITITFGKSWTGTSDFGYLRFHPEHIHYDFPPPSNTTSNTTTTSSTKTPIPIGAYLITTAFFTYILYRKSKT